MSYTKHSAPALTDYLMTYLILITLASISLALSLVHLDHGELALAIGIAIIKAALVLWVFMQFAAQSSSSRLVMLLAASLIVLLAGLTASDVATRTTIPAAPLPTENNSFYLR